jgi:hypothetical protein
VGHSLGILLAPVQIARNLKAMLSGPAPEKPSPQMENTVRRQFASSAPTMQ